MDVAALRRIALSLPEVTEEPHFDKTSYKVNTKIFATVVPEHSRATVKLSPADQDIFCLGDKMVVYPVPNKWGKQGWTHVSLDVVQEEMLTELIKVAYCAVAPKHLAALINFE